MRNSASGQDCPVGIQKDRLRKTFVPVTPEEWEKWSLRYLRKMLEPRMDHLDRLRIDAKEIMVPQIQNCAEIRKVQVDLIDDVWGYAQEIVRIPYHMPWPRIISDMLDELRAWQCESQKQRRAG